MMTLVVFEGAAELGFHQVAVVSAETEAMAAVLLAAFLQKRGMRFVEIDSEGTRRVSMGNFPEEWLANGAPSEGVIGLSGRVWFKPE